MSTLHSAPIDPVNGAGSEQGGPHSKARLADAFALVGDSDISDAELRLWLHYRQHHIDNRGAFISDEATTAALGWSARKVQDVRASLIRHALLRVVPRGPQPPARYPRPHPNPKGSHEGSRERSHPTAGTIKDTEPRKPGNRKTYMTQIETDFDDFWSAYPKRAGGNPRPKALTAYTARRDEGVSAEALLAGVQAYAAFMEHEGTVGTQYVKQAQFWLAPSYRGWEEDWSVPDEPMSSLSIDFSTVEM